VGATPAFAASAAFTQVSGSPFTTGDGPDSVAFSPSGGLLATGSENGLVWVFSVAGGGALSQVAGSPFASNFDARSVAFSPSGGLLASADLWDGTVSVFAPAPPTATVSQPAGGGTYTVDQPAPTSFSCADPTARG
jgi:6-phosphogluconolactonase